MRRGTTRRSPASPTAELATPAGELELVWRGKYDADGRRVRQAPDPVELQTLEVHGSPEIQTKRRRSAAPPSALVWGDNLGVLDAWTAAHEGAVDLVYIDPPFSTGTEFDVATRGVDRNGEVRVVRQPAYSDRWSGGASAYLSMLAPRVERIHRLLAPHGSLYLHVDPILGHAVRLMVDEIFGADSFQREIVWRIGWVSGFKTRARNWIRNHDTILFYAKDPQRMRFNKLYVAHPPGYARREGASAKAPGMAIDDVWNAGEADLALVGNESLDSIQIKSFSREKTGYATQKNQSLLRRIIGASSNPGDLVLDAFCGAGTTPVVAAQLGRRFLACDVGEPAIALTRARLLASSPAAAWTLAASKNMLAPPRAAKVEPRSAATWRVIAPLGDGKDAAVLDVAIDRGGRWRIELVEVALPCANPSVHEAIAAGVEPWLELAMDWRAGDGPFAASTRASPSDGRSHASEALGSQERVAVLLVDLLHRRSRIDLVRGRDGALRATVQ